MARKLKTKPKLVMTPTTQAILDGMNNGFTEEQIRQYTINDVRLYLNTQTLNEGLAKCPCCYSHVQTYKRTCSRTQAYLLMVLYKISKSNSKYVKLADAQHYLYERLRLNASDTTVLKYFGLIEESPEETSHYKLTQLGLDFISGKAKIPKNIHVTNGYVWKKSPELIFISDCKRFFKEDLLKLEL